MPKTQLSIETASKLLKALLLLAVVISTVAAGLISLYIQEFLPHGSGISYALLGFNTETVGISLLGALLPVSAALLCVVILRFISWPKNLPKDSIGLSFWVAVWIVTILSTAAFSVSSLLYGTIYLPESWSAAMVFIGAAGGVIYAWFKGRNSSLAVTILECYAVGTLGMILSDVLRTFSGQISVPDGVALWGGGGLLDFVFWFGIYMSLGCAFFGALARLFSRMTKTTFRLKLASSTSVDAPTV